eukprot:403336939
MQHYKIDYYWIAGLKITVDCDYVVQPRAMIGRGSMCVTELYGKNMRIKVVQNLIENRKKDDQIQRMKLSLLRRDTVSPNTISSSSILSPMIRERKSGINEIQKYSSQSIGLQRSSSKSLKNFRQQSTLKLRPSTVKLAEYNSTPNRLQMLQEDEKDLHSIIQDARKFLGNNLLKNTQFDFSAKYDSPFSLYKQNKGAMSPGRDKQIGDQLKIKLQKSSRNDEEMVGNVRNSIGKRRKSTFQMKQTENKKYQMKRIMTSCTIDLPSDSDDKSQESQESKKVIPRDHFIKRVSSAQKIQFNDEVFPVTRFNRVPSPTPQSKSRVKFNFQDSPLLNNQMSNNQNQSDLSVKNLKSFTKLTQNLKRSDSNLFPVKQPYDTTNLILEQASNFSSSSFHSDNTDDMLKKTIAPSDFQIKDQNKRLKQRKKIMKLLNIEVNNTANKTNFNSRNAQTMQYGTTNQLRVKQKLRTYDTNIEGVDTASHTLELKTEKTQKSRFIDRLAQSKPDPKDSSNRLQRSETIHQEWFISREQAGFVLQILLSLKNKKRVQAYQNKNNKETFLISLFVSNHSFRVERK